jgi:hypothetical protein
MEVVEDWHRLNDGVLGRAEGRELVLQVLDVPVILIRLTQHPSNRVHPHIHGRHLCRVHFRLLDDVLQRRRDFSLHIVS